MRKRSWKDPVAGVAAVGIAAIVLAGCGSSVRGQADPPSVAVVVGNRSNSVPLRSTNLPAGLVSGWVGEGATVSFVVCDGLPQVSATVNLAASGPNSLYANEAAAANVTLGTKELLSIRATASGADTLGAIALAGRSVAGSSGRTVVVFDSGLDTVAPLPFQDGILVDSPEEVVRFLRASDELPSLSGDKVVWYGLGQVAPPQQPLTIADLGRLQAIWRAVLEAAGAASVDIVPSPLPTAAELSGLPPVPVVPIGAISSLTASTPSPVVVPLSATSVEFVPGEAVYLHPAKANAVLSGLAHEIVAGHFDHVTVTGTAALPGWQWLSKARAVEAKTTLVADGVPSHEITAVGVGEHFPGFVPDRTPAGLLESVQAEEDRLIIVKAWN